VSLRAPPPLPADHDEDSRPQPPSDTGQRILEGVPLEGGEISRPRAATCVPDIHDRHHRSVHGPGHCRD